MLKIYNTLTKEKQEFKPVDTGVIKMYACGVTVYDDCHIGHARSLYTFDWMRRYLAYRKFRVEFVRNITDIDDKIIRRAQELNIDWQQLVERYIAAYYRDLARLGVSRADYEPRATENIAEMIEFISRLIAQDFAYVTESGVYFSVRKFKDYGKLSGQSIDQMLEGVRKESDETKHDFLDFALWKSSKPNEPSWPSPWGAGRPGWHIECSVMSAKYLKRETLDIHAGGRDLVFPHHENEIAQSEVLSGKKFANYWIHHGLLTINAQKMAKSLGNFITISDVLAKYPASILKIFYLQAHYSSNIDFTWEKMEEAKKAYARLYIFANKLKEKVVNSVGIIRGDMALIEQFNDEFVAALDDDFNSPKGLGVLFDLVTVGNKVLESDGQYKNFKLRRIFDIFETITGIFGLEFQMCVTAQISDQEIDELIKQRREAKLKRDFKNADQIRQDLENKGVILEDSKDGQTSWRRKL